MNGPKANHSNLRTPGRGWAYTGAILGGLISIAANVAHSFVAPSAAAADWSPKPGAVIGSTFWPILLFVAVEILARYKWPKGFWFAVLRFGGLIPVVAVAGLVSYRHLRGLLLYYGEDQIVATLGPLAVDGLMVMATAALVAAAIQKHQASSIPDARPTPAVAPVPGYTPSRPANTASDTPSVVTAQIPVSDRLMDNARFAFNAHRHRTGQDMTADQLGMVMNVAPDIAREVLALLGTVDALPMPVLNGQLTAGGAR